MQMAETSNPRKIRHTGNSSAVTIPPAILDEAGLERGDRVVLEAEGSTVTMTKAEWRRVDS